MVDAFFSLCTIIGLIVIMVFAFFLVLFIADTFVEKITGKSFLEREIERMKEENERH